MEDLSGLPSKNKETRNHRPYAFEKMEVLVREMQNTENGVPVRSQKQFLSSIPSAFMGYDLIEWLMERLNIEESVEAVHVANQLCQYGYYFPVNDSRNLTVKDDGSLYRFQIPYYWPWQHRTPDSIEYAIYLTKRTLRNKQRHGLEEYEAEAMHNLKKNLQSKWEMIQSQAEEQIRLTKDRKKGDKIVHDSQERAFWRIYRPPPGFSSNLDTVPVPSWTRQSDTHALSRKRILNDLQREVQFYHNSLSRTRIKISAALKNLTDYFQTYLEYDPMMTQPQPTNPWITDDQTFWFLNSPMVEVATEKRVKRWGLSMEELMTDPRGLQEFTTFLRKEYSHENIRFYLAVKELKKSRQTTISNKVSQIFREFLVSGAPCEINIDSKTTEKVNQEMKNPTRFTFDAAAEHVYTLLLKKDCYPRFIRSDHYKNLLATAVQPMQKKRFFPFGGPGKKKTLSATLTSNCSTQQQSEHQQLIISRDLANSSNLQRDSDRSLSGSALELEYCGKYDIMTTPQVSYSHSQSNLADSSCRSKLNSEASMTNKLTIKEKRREIQGSPENTKIEKKYSDLHSGGKVLDQLSTTETKNIGVKNNILTNFSSIDTIDVATKKSEVDTDTDKTIDERKKSRSKHTADSLTVSDDINTKDLKKLSNSQKQSDNNNTNEVCPWEDEDSCQVDAPYVKTYATLGYL